MTVFEKIKSIILKVVGVKKLEDNPNSRRYMFINDDNKIKRANLAEYRIWYVGDSDEIENLYTEKAAGENQENPIYNRNKPAYFWAINVKNDEQPIKKVHSGIPKAIVDTLSAVIGMPKIDCASKHDTLQQIMKVNHFAHKLTQEGRPLTFVEGWGAWKVNFNKDLSEYPIIQYYEGENVDYIVKSGLIIGIVYRDYYKYQKKNYVLLETRCVENGNSIIRYELYRLEKSNEVEQVPINTIPELADLEDKVIPGLKKILGVPSKYFFDVMNKNYGKSIFAGKIDVFDDIDQCLSQASQTDRVSTPVEYYPTDVLERDKNGKTTLPSVYNRQYVATEVTPDGDGQLNGKIETTQPVLNYEQYIIRYKSLIDVAITGTLSPATMGIDVAKKDNAEAQREKEKATMYTRDNVCGSEDRQIKDLMEICLIVKEYMDTGKITVFDYDITVQYNEFANPTFESMATILLPLWTSGAISTKMYVDKLYGDGLSDEEKEKEIAALEENKKMDNYGDMSQFGLDEGNFTNGTEIKESDEPKVDIKKATNKAS